MSYIHRTYIHAIADRIIIYIYTKYGRLYHIHMRLLNDTIHTFTFSAGCGAAEIACQWRTGLPGQECRHREVAAAAAATGRRADHRSVLAVAVVAFVWCCWGVRAAAAIAAHTAYRWAEQQHREQQPQHRCAVADAVVKPSGEHCVLARV